MEQDISYESIERNVDEAKQDGLMMHCIFRCPVTGQQVSANAHIARSQSTGAVVKRSALGNIFFEIRHWIRRTMYNLFGLTASEVASDLTDEATDRIENRASEEERKEAIVRAFSSVRGRFTWDAQQKCWVLTETDAAS